MGETIETRTLAKAVLALLDEAYLASPSPRGTWFADNEPDNGFLGSVGSLGAAEASRPLTPGDPLTVASHACHLRFALGLANRAAEGENPYAGADWARSWEARSVTEAEWRELVDGLRAEYEELRGKIEGGAFWDDEDALTGVLGLVAHGAWHLGAIRQGLGRVAAPR